MALRILLADDEKEFVDTLAERLRLRGYDVRVVYDGLSALNEADKDVPDVAVLDLFMPGLSGDAALHRLKAAHPGLPVIVLTGHEAVDDNGVCPLAQAVACLTKPLAFKDFLAAGEAAAREGAAGDAANGGGRS